ncbi:hypothetical protein DRP04_07795 [Archaeoglobales archaeon]|nr:MAG: hypothetical protein DRP04_07795 [Archaeoglobales archaeon]
MRLSRGIKGDVKMLYDLTSIVSRIKEVVKNDLQVPTDPWSRSERSFTEYAAPPEEWYHPSIIEEDEEEHSIKLLDYPLIKEYSEVRNEWLDLIKDRFVYGIDGSSAPVRREELIYIIARAGYYSYPRNKPEQVGILSLHDAFFIIDRGFVKNMDKLIKADPESQRIRIYESDLQKGTLLVTWDMQSRRSLKHSYVAVRARLQGLTEVIGLEELIKIVDKEDSEEVIFLIDGPLYPVSTNCDREVLPRFREADKKNILVCGITKRIETRMLVSHLAKIHKIEKERYGSDLSFLHRLLKPMNATAFFLWENRARLKRVPEEWLPTSCYFMTIRGEIYRLDLPYKYYEEKRAEEMLKLTLALSIANGGGLPLPVDRADRRWSFSMEERKILARNLDNFVKQILGVDLTKPYGEGV